LYAASDGTFLGPHLADDSNDLGSKWIKIYAYVDEIEKDVPLTGPTATRAAFSKTKFSMNFDDTGVVYTSLGPF
jgi:hypothetical protein